MNWRPCTQMVRFLPLGGEGWLRADSRKGAFEFGGLMMLGSLTNVTTVRMTRISAAPTVQPISRRVLPWICAATRTFLARNLYSE